jgi:carbon monoxide dehydrogenase subunit G
MRIDVEVRINAGADVVWDLVADIAHSASIISGIERVDILDRPETGLVGLRWRETRTMFGKTATEVMWITEAEEGVHYATEARSHGSVYRSRILVEDLGAATRLGLTFAAEAEGLLTKLLSLVFMGLMKGATRKALQQDLEDIKAAAESRVATVTGKQP